MANQKVTQLTENTAPAAADVLHIIDDPGGTPANQKVTVKNLVNTYRKGDVRLHGAAIDGTTDTQAAFVAANAAEDVVIVDGGLDYVIASNLTMTVPVRIEPGSRIKPSTGVTVTLNGGLIADLGDWEEKRTGDGSMTIGVAQEVNADWWKAKSTTLASPNDTIQLAITGTARGSELRFRGQYVTTPVDVVFDEDNQATTTNRDAGKSFIGVGGEAFRLGTQSVELGAQWTLGNSEDDDLLTFTGVRTSGDQPSRASIKIDKICLDGNKANNASGRCLYFVSTKDVYGNLFAKDANDDGIVWSSTASESSNVCNFGTIISVNHGGDSINSGGLGDSQWGDVQSGGVGGDGAIIGSGITVSTLRIYVCGDHGLVINGNSQVGKIRVNDCDDANILIASATAGARIDSVHSSESALAPSSDNLDSHVAYSAVAIDSYIGSLHCDDSGTAAKRHAYFLNGCARNVIDSYSSEGTATGNRVQFATGAEDDGNSVRPASAAIEIAYSASITPDPYDGRALLFEELTGNLSLGNFAAALLYDGQQIVTRFDADGTDRTITWNARWSHTDGATTTVLANTTRQMHWASRGGVFELISDQVYLGPQTPAYSESNVTTDRTFDADAAAGAITSPPTQAEVENIRDAVLELADVVGTLVDDLRTLNITS